MDFTMYKSKLDKIMTVFELPFALKDEEGGVVYSSYFNETCTNERTIKTGLGMLTAYTSEGDEGDKLLLVVDALTSGNESSDKEFFYKNLLVNGESASGRGSALAVDNSDIYGYVVISVSLTRATEQDKLLVVEILNNLFAKESGAVVVNVSECNYAICCPMSSTSLDDLQEIADSIPNTLMSEVMVNSIVSMGTVKSSLDDISKSYEEALKAAEIGNVFDLTDKCIRCDKLGVYSLVYGLSADVCVNYLHESLGANFFRDKSGPDLLRTMKVLTENNMSITEASKALYVHRNTLLYRTDKFHKLTGLDPTKFSDSFTIRMICIIIKYLENTEPEKLLAHIAFYRNK